MEDGAKAILTLHVDVERAAVALVFGRDLAAVATCVSVHHLDDVHLVGVDLTKRHVQSKHTHVHAHKHAHRAHVYS